MSVLKLLENVVNHLLSCDQDALDEVARLSGKVIQVELLNTAQPVVSLIPHEQGIQICDDYVGAGDVLMRGTPLQLLAYLNSSRDDKAVLTGGALEIKGDLHLAQDFQRMLRRLEIDREEQLARLIGDTLARKAHNAGNSAMDFLRQLKNKIQLDLGEYALYEKEALPDRDEIENFNSRVDTLRDDLERLRQRLESLSVDSE